VDLVPDAPFADFPTATAAVVHFGRLEHGQRVEGDEVRRKGIGKSCPGSIAVSECTVLLQKKKLTKDTSTEQRNKAAGQGRYE
jgi:hypothetical protein